MKSYQELTVWQKSFNLVLLIYKITKSFPKEELYVLVSQIRRAAISIVSNIAESYTRKTTKEYIQFIQIAFGSAAELETQLLIAKELGYINLSDYQNLNFLLQEVLKMLNGLVTSLRSKTNH